MASSKTSPASAPSPGWGRRQTWLGVGLLALALALAYLDSFHVPILLDDVPAITENASIRDLAQIGKVLTPPPNTGPSGRPLLNLTFAVNYALGGEAVFGYHVFNLGVHFAVALLLFGVVRRLLQAEALRARFGDSASPLAAAVALLWAVHPLLTETVTYISQRAEALMALFYLGTVYGLLRSIERASHAGRWLVVAAISCWLGMMTKEAMATAPFVVFVLDWIFLAGSAREVFRRRGSFYVSLAASWILLAGLMRFQGTHTVGFEKGIDAWTYLLTECIAIGHYVRAAVAPVSLLFDFGPVFAHHLSQVWPQACLIVALLALTVYLLVRRPSVGFAGVWFFIILSPTSSFIPVALQPMAESRMYLPLMAIVTVAVLAGFCWLGRRVFPVVAALALLGGVGSYVRNKAYRSDQVLWLDTVAKAPLNSRAHNNLGLTYAVAGDLPRAIPEYRLSLQLVPSTATVHYNLGKALFLSGDKAGSITEYQEALRLNPAYSEARIALATSLAESGRGGEATSELRQAVLLKPGDYKAHYNLGLNLFRSGEIPASVSEFERAIALEPDEAEPHNALATAFLQTGKESEARAEYERALRLDPSSADAQANLGNLLLASDQVADAKAHFEAALKSRPGFGKAETGLGLSCMALGQPADAKKHFDEAVRLDPSDAEARFRLGNLAAMAGDMPGAAAQWEYSLRLRPNDPEAHNNLATAYSQLGRFDDAIREYQEAIRLKPDYDRARANLADLLAQRGR